MKVTFVRPTNLPSMHDDDDGDEITSAANADDNGVDVDELD